MEINLEIASLISAQENNVNQYEKYLNEYLKYAEKTKMYETSDSIFIHSNQSKLSFAKSDLPLNSAMIVPTSAIAFMSELDLLLPPTRSPVSGYPARYT